GITDTGEPSEGTPIDLDGSPAPKERGRPRKGDDPITAALRSIADGKRQPGSGPTGKKMWVYPSPGERLRALEMLRSIGGVQAQAAEPEPEPDIEEVRKAASDFLGHPAAAPPAPTIIKEGDSEVISFTDEQQAERWHAERASSQPKGPTNKRIFA